MRRLLREPLLHFFLLGAALFAFDALWSERAARVGDDEIIVPRGRIENLAALFAKTWQRPPTATELRGLVDDYVLEEALYREGVALGVDQNDTIIRRRVRQKMEFVLDDIIEQAGPTEVELERWLAEHPAAYRRPVRYRFLQIMLDPEQRGDNLAADARRILAELRDLEEGADPRGLGDRSLLEHAFADVSMQDIDATFGREFSEGLPTLPTGEWSGPVESAFGLHLVRIDACTGGELPPLAEVRAEVARDWGYAQREEFSERFYEGLLARYRIVIEWPVDAGEVEEARKP